MTKDQHAESWPSRALALGGRLLRAGMLLGMLSGMLLRMLIGMLIGMLLGMLIGMLIGILIGIQPALRSAYAFLSVQIRQPKPHVAP